MRCVGLLESTTSVKCRGRWQVTRSTRGITHSGTYAQVILVSTSNTTVPLPPCTDGAYIWCGAQRSKAALGPNHPAPACLRFVAPKLVICRVDIVKGTLSTIHRAVVLLFSYGVFISPVSSSRPSNWHAATCQAHSFLTARRVP